MDVHVQLFAFTSKEQEKLQLHVSPWRARSIAFCVRRVCASLIPGTNPELDRRSLL